MHRATQETNEPPPQPSLVVILRPSLPRHDELVLGRSSSCDLAIDDATVSRQHARVGLGPTPWVEDLGSRLGTWVRGQRLAPGERRALDPGEPIRLGEAVVLVHRGGPAVVPHRLTLASTGAWFAVDGGAPVSFGRRRLLSRLLLTLVEAREQLPGVPVAATRLQAEGWPGERVDAAVAANRLYVAIARLRGLGLGELIQSHDQGYLLRPSVAIQRVAPGLRG
jgi:hypothetical protein